MFFFPYFKTNLTNLDTHTHKYGNDCNKKYSSLKQLIQSKTKKTTIKMYSSAKFKIKTLSIKD